MRVKDFVARCSGFRDPGIAAGTLVFLHELSDPGAVAQPPGVARWQRLIAAREHECGQALDDACQACVQTWPEQLDGFFGDVRFAAEPSHTVKSAIGGMQKLADGASAAGGPWDRRTLLASVSQELRGLSSRQARGAFFTPWHIAEMMARILLEPQDPSELWVLEPCVGGAVMLLAALAVYRERHGARAADALTLIGVDIDPRVCQIARASLLLAGADPNQFWIFCGDSLAQPIVGRDRGDGKLKTVNFHASLSNPPFGGKVSSSELEAHAMLGPLVIPDHVLYRQIPVRATRTPASARTQPGK
jgi:hypothetical protein